jgi:hypothetical protein
MRALVVDFWLRHLVDDEQIRQIDMLVNQVGKEVSASQSTWHEYKQSLTIQERPIDRMLQLNLSARLRSTLTDLDQMTGRSADDAAVADWGFLFADTSPLAGAPSADNYMRQNQYPQFGIFIRNEPFRLLTSWGTNFYDSQQSLVKYANEYEAIVSQLGFFPVSEALLFSRYPFDALLAGHLAIRLLEIFDGYMIVSRLDLLPASEIDDLLNRTHQHSPASTIHRLVTHFETPNGRKEYVQQFIDVHFLREWIKQPSFNLF